MSTWSEIRRWMHFIRENGSLNQGRIALLIFVSAGFSVFSALSVSLLLPFVNIIFAVSALPALHPSLIIPTEGRLPWLAGVCAATWFLFVLKNMLFSVAGRITTQIKTSIVSGIRTRMMDSLTRHSFEHVRQIRTGPMIEQLFDGTEQLGGKSALLLAGVAKHGVLVAAYLLILFWLDAALMAFSLVLVPVVSLAGHLVSRRIRRLSERRAQAMSALIQHVQQRLHAMKLIRVLHGESLEREHFERNNRELSATERRREAVENSGLAITEMTGVSAGLLLLLVLGIKALSGDFPHGPGGLILFVAAVFSLIDPMRHLLQMQPMMDECILLSARLEAACRVPPSSVTFTRVPGFSESLEWSGVRFSYGTTGRQILNDSSFVVHKGDKIAVSGRSGIGKTTFVDLTLGLYPPESGRITLDGKPVHTIAPEDRSRIFGVMTQDAFVFHDTIRNNVVYNFPDAGDRDVMDVLEKVQLGEWVRRRPGGLDEILGERGQDMSGGEKQRLALARILLRRPEILILDEATSSLDPETERAILTLLSQLFRDRTILLVSHRASVLAFAERRFEVSGGRILEQKPI